MKKYHTIKNIRFEEKALLLNIDGTNYKFPLKLVSNKLSNPQPDELSNFIISPSGYGIHWPLLDEDISIDGLLKIKSASKPLRKRTSFSK